MALRGWRTAFARDRDCSLWSRAILQAAHSESGDGQRLHSGCKEQHLQKKVSAQKPEAVGVMAKTSRDSGNAAERERTMLVPKSTETRARQRMSDTSRVWSDRW